VRCAVAGPDHLYTLNWDHRCLVTESRANNVILAVRTFIDCDSDALRMAA
jgi:hypothetical protein